MQENVEKNHVNKTVGSMMNIIFVAVVKNPLLTFTFKNY